MIGDRHDFLFAGADLLRELPREASQGRAEHAGSPAASHRSRILLPNDAARLKGFP
jgi:hypothetical protein